MSHCVRYHELIKLPKTEDILQSHNAIRRRYNFGSIMFPKAFGYLTYRLMFYILKFMLFFHKDQLFQETRSGVVQCFQNSLSFVKEKHNESLFDWLNACFNAIYSILETWFLIL